MAALAISLSGCLSDDNDNGTASGEMRVENNTSQPRDNRGVYFAPVSPPGTPFGGGATFLAPGGGPGISHQGSVILSPGEHYVCVERHQADSLTGPATFRGSTILPHTVDIPSGGEGTYGPNREPVLRIGNLSFDSQERCSDRQPPMTGGPGTGVALQIDPDEINDGNSGQTYSFDFRADRIPSHVRSVTFNISWGDGNSDSEIVTVSNGTARHSASKAYERDGMFGLVVTMDDESGQQLASADALITIGQVTTRPTIDLNACDTWVAANSGGQGGTRDPWDISSIPRGAKFDIKFDARNIPDKYIVRYEGQVVLDTGWRGADSYEGNPLYPGGIAGPGADEEHDIFRKGSTDNFHVTVIGPQRNTVWYYSIRCRTD
ncbi:hypothetical protein [Halorhodospira abdelmalekii]|uniref:hypothetical protein n=1 Tax=Halorhodospira abdelmalekii TaxID=421629 RepID=UPI001905DCE5|nr:hypothetical protein [Halorhodospira abdelmalekii]